jgi:hypothetical protein
MTQQQLIQRLKQQPKQGSTPSWTTFLRDLGAAATGIIPALKDITEIVGTEAVAAFGKLDSETTKINLGFSQFVQLQEEVQASLKEVAGAATYYEKSFKKTSDSMGIGFNAAERLTRQFLKMSQDMSGASETTKMTAEQFSKYGGIIKKILPNMKQLGLADNEFYQGMMQTNFLLDQSIGLTAEQAESFTQYAASNADNAAQQLKFTQAVAKALGDTNGDLGYTQMITAGIAEAGADIQLQYGRLPGSLEQATIKASRLGLKLEDLAGAGEALLDIESSIGKELEYQLLTGRQLTNDQNQSLTNLYREATLRGDANKQADILTEIVEKEGDNLEKNLFARKQMADLLGIQEQQLASAIQKQKIIEKAGENGIKINISDNGSIAAAAQQLANDNKLTQEELKQFNDSNDKRTTEDLLEQQLQNSNEQLVLQKLNFARTSTQAMRDDFTAAVEEMKRIQQNQSAEDMKSLGATLLAGNIAGTVFNALKNRAGSGFAVKAPTYSAGGTTGGPSDDLIATPTGYGDRILLAGEDTFALNNDDTVVAGTNLFPKSNSGNSNLASKIDEMIAEIRNQTRILSKRDNTFGAGINSAYYG